MRLLRIDRDAKAVRPPAAAHGEPKLVESYSLVHALRGRTAAAMSIVGRIRRPKPPHLRIIYEQPARATGTPGVEVDLSSIFILKLNCQVTDMRSPARTQLHHDAGRAEEDPPSPQCEFVAVLNQ